MKNANTPAMPGDAEISNKGEAWAFQVGTNSKFKFPGLTKRELFAMNLMNGILSNNDYSYSGFSGAASMATEAADALLKELEK